MTALSIFIIVYMYAMLFMVLTADMWIDTRFGKTLDRVFTRISRALAWAWFRLIRKDRT